MEGPSLLPAGTWVSCWTSTRGRFGTGWRPRSAQHPAGSDAEVSADAAAELRRLRAENAELRRANEILKTASAFFAQAEPDRRLK
jgi:transposase-like protein